MDGIGIGIMDTLGFLVVLTVLGSFAFWLMGYFTYEYVKTLFRGPSEQLQSVGTSILSERELPVPLTAPAALTPQMPMVMPLALEEPPTQDRPKAA